MTYAPHMLPKLRCEALRAACADMPCCARVSSLIPGHRCSASATVVGAHLPVAGKGMGSKVTDLAIVAACDNCHRLIDRVDPRWKWLADTYPAAFYDRLLNGWMETLTFWLDAGVLTIPDAEWEMV